LVRPDVVKAATQAYLEEQDLFTQWVDAECTTDINDSATHVALFASWSKFAQANGEAHGSGAQFTESMKHAGFRPVKHTPLHNSSRGYMGIALRLADPADWRDPG
jgi:putative DNA primase/helicase